MEQESFEQLVIKVRNDFVTRLENWAENKSLRTGLRESMRLYAEDVRSGRPVRISGPVEADILDAALYNFGIRSDREGSEKYRQSGRP